MRTRTLLIISGTLSFPSLFAQGGSYYSGFGVDGKAKEDLSNAVQRIEAADIATDGSIYAAGYTIDQNEFKGLIWKVDENGNDDLSFNGTSTKVTGEPGENVFIEGIQVTTTGKPIVYGFKELQGVLPQSFIERRNSDGSDDLTFNNTGSIILSLPNAPVFAQAGLLDPTDDHFFCAVKQGSTSFDVQRYDEVGDIVASWGNSGSATIDLGISTSVADMKWAANPNDLIVLGYTLDSGDNDMFAASLNGSGSLNTGFGNNGVASVDFFNGTEILTAGAIQLDGKILMAGFVNDLTFDEATIRRLNNDGSLDQDFGVSGEFRIDLFPGSERLTGVQYANDKIFIGGHGDDGTSQRLFAGSLNYDGSWNTSFGGGIGYVQHDLYNDQLDEFSNFLIMAGTAKLLLGGATEDAISDLDAMLVMLYSGLSMGMDEEEYPFHSLEVYPDPVLDGQLNLRLELNTPQDLSISIHELSGKLIGEIAPVRNFQTGKQNIDMVLPAWLAQGTYMIGVNNGNMTRYTTIRVL